MKIALYVALYLCIMIVIAGIAVWFTSNPFLVKFLASSITAAPGIAFGSIIVDMLKEE